MTIKKFILTSIFLVSAAAAHAEIGGTYRVSGTNPDGSSYTGTCVVSKVPGMAENFTFNWVVGGNTYSGTGTLTGDTLTVNWGDQYPVIYKVLGGGATLSGTWSNGRAAETLSK